jgi:hypothetical protein
MQEPFWESFPRKFSFRSTVEFSDNIFKYITQRLKGDPLPSVNPDRYNC